MASISTVKKRTTTIPAPLPDFGAGIKENAAGEHPAGEVKHGRGKQLIRFLFLTTYFWAACFSIVATQFCGAPLYWVNKDLYYAYMALTKQSFGLLVTTMTQWWSPTVVRISGDKSVAGQIKQRADGRVEFSFPDRLVMIANHQLYTDWLYLWWVGYANRPSHHGHLYIILKESLKYIPIIGQGIRFYGFIFMSRKMETDKPRIAHRLQKLKEKHSGPLSGTDGLDPMWLLLFPEGTNLSNNGRNKSAAWAEKQGIPDMQHQLLPRSTGTFFCLNELKGTVEWVYDCTVAYEGIPRGQYGQDIFTLRSTFFEGRPPRSVNMYWRRFAVSSLPLEDPEKFDLWIRKAWTEKDALIEQYMTTGRFPASKDLEINSMNSEIEGRQKGFIETGVRQEHWWEFLQIFSVLAVLGLVANIMARVWNVVWYGRAGGLPPTVNMNEDERYRASTQFRLWSFTPERLVEMRSTTNQIAAGRVKEAIQRARASRAASASASGETSEAEQNGAGSRSASTVPESEVNCLTVEEELKLVAFYCRQTLQLGDHLKVPTDVKATAIQYMKRFYITNSLMTYHPTSILKTALFFATKTENHYFRLSKFADAIGKTKAEDVLASEFLLTQGLRFTFDVRHPFRALEGAVMELQAMAGGSMPPLPGTEPVMPPPELSNMKKRVREAHGKAREYLKTSALLTDVYFHYTPSQIMFASLLIADEELTRWYLGTKLPPTSNSLYETLLLTLRRCADALLAVPPTSEPSAVEMKELKQLAKKLQKCQNPDMVDLVKVNERKKREGNDSGLDEKVIKKRKLERENNQKDGEDLFGPALGKPKDDNGLI